METTAQGVVLAVKVVPNSSRDLIAGLLGDELKVKVSRPPEGGKANEAVVELLAGVLGIPAKRVAVVSGHTQARKRVLVVGMAAGEIQARLLP